MEPDEIRARIWDVVDRGDERFVLSTVDAEGRPRSRMMGARLRDGKAIYMATHAGSRKLDQIRANPRVALLLHRPDYARVATIEGCAAIETSPDRKGAFWDAHPILARHFSGRDDPMYTLVRVEAERGELLDAELGFETLSVDL